ncbi:MAG: helix-turn-helix domain-containing protein [Bacteriovoracia bacterium]
MVLKKGFASTLKNLRLAKGLSQESLGMKAELDRSYVSLLEREMRSPTLTTLNKICDVLEVLPSSFIEMIEIPILNENAKDFFGQYCLEHKINCLRKEAHLLINCYGKILYSSEQTKDFTYNYSGDLIGKCIFEYFSIPDIELHFNDYLSNKISLLPEKKLIIISDKKSFRQCYLSIVEIMNVPERLFNVTLIQDNQISLTGNCNTLYCNIIKGVTDSFEDGIGFWFLDDYQRIRYLNPWLGDKLKLREEDYTGKRLHDIKIVKSLLPHLDNTEKNLKDVLNWNFLNDLAEESHFVIFSRKIVDKQKRLVGYFSFFIESSH